MKITSAEIDRKVWGYEEKIVSTGKYCGKKLHLNEGYRCSIHSHPKDETFYIQTGKVYLELENENGFMESGILLSEDIVHIVSDRFHRFSGLEDSVIIEFSTPDTQSTRKTTSEKIPDFEKWRKEIFERWKQRIIKKYEK